VPGVVFEFELGEVVVDEVVDADHAGVGVVGDGEVGVGLVGAGPEGGGLVGGLGPGEVLVCCCVVEGVVVADVPEGAR
jgi:hypothetical protein